MNLKISYLFNNIVILKITGKRTQRFLEYLYRLNIHLYDVYLINKDELIIYVDKASLDKIMSIKTTCEINIYGYEGKLKIINYLKKHFLLFISLIIGYLFLLLLSNIIFDIEIMHSNSNIRNLIKNELNEFDIKKWSFYKDYKTTQSIKESILSKHKDVIEWLEINRIGTKYIIKVEERKESKNSQKFQFQDIISTNNAIIMKIEAINGEIIKQKNDYVKKGDILISGKIMKGEEVIKLVQADGKIYGEVWYNIKVEQPLIYQINVPTGKIKEYYKIIFLNYEIPLFNNKSFNNKEINTNNILMNKLIPFKIIKEIHQEIKIEDKRYNEKDMINKALKTSVEKMTESLSKDEYIISNKLLKYYKDNDKLYLEVFFRVYKSIGEPKEIVE